MPSNTKTVYDPCARGMNVPMELRHLRYFLSVAEAANVSRAAREINISQPALSRQIRDLETELGVRIFDRVGRRIRLTAAGEDLLRQTRDVLTHAESLVDRARALSCGSIGVLRVGATPQMLQSFLATFLVRYRRSRPGIDVRLIEGGSARLLDLLEQGEIHVAVGPVPVGTRLASRLLLPIRVAAVAGPGWQWPQRSIEIRELAGEPLLLMRQGVASRQLFDAACRIAHMRPRILLESDQPQSLLSVADAGQGIAIVPSTVRLVSNRMRMRPLLQEGQSLGTWGGVVWDPRRTQPVYAASFVDELAAYRPRMHSSTLFERLAPPVPRPAATTADAPSTARERPHVKSTTGSPQLTGRVP